MDTLKAILFSLYCLFDNPKAFATAVNFVYECFHIFYKDEIESGTRIRKFSTSELLEKIKNLHTQQEGEGK
jgi:hypothetical protein